MLIINIKCILICVLVVLCVCYDGLCCFVYIVFFKIYFVLNLICYFFFVGFFGIGYGFLLKVIWVMDSVCLFLRFIFGFMIFVGLIFGREVVICIFCMEKRFLNKIVKIYKKVVLKLK